MRSRRRRTHALKCVCGGNEDKPVHMRCVFLYMTPFDDHDDIALGGAVRARARQQRMRVARRAS
jgi:hypothetical protein